jgi:hypothetical protein
LPIKRYRAGNLIYLSHGFVPFFYTVLCSFRPLLPGRTMPGSVRACLLRHFGP